MAFKFNWSPLTADAGFYDRARELLTAALNNKTPKPPIIVDDIIVRELNLGSVPPELEILEVGDLAEDRFRGIFKMCYSGDAFLTLQTRVQANPLNTFLLTTPSFTSPRPLAAAAGLTIPLQITLSEIRLSAFIILVFSRQKGLTLVFRNDPLESLKVSSTLDSIPFVRDYLQKEIEGQLRYLLMEELPAIIHRLSLRLWVPDHIAATGPDDGMSATAGRGAEESRSEQKPINPLASPVQQPAQTSDFGLDSFEPLSSTSTLSSAAAGTSDAWPSDAPPSLFCQKNMIRLAALANSHRTLSLFTPSIRDAVFRAWAGASERGDAPGAATPATPGWPSLSRSHSYSASSGSIGGGGVGSSSSSNSLGPGSYASTASAESGHAPVRPSLSSFSSAMSGLSLASARHHAHGRAHAGKKRRRRVVDLRRTQSAATTATTGTLSAVETEKITPATTAAAVSATSTISAIPSGLATPFEAVAEDDELTTPPMSPKSKPGARRRSSSESFRQRRPALGPGPAASPSPFLSCPVSNGNTAPVASPPQPSPSPSPTPSTPRPVSRSKASPDTATFGAAAAVSVDSSSVDQGTQTSPFDQRYPLPAADSLDTKPAGATPTQASGYQGSSVAPTPPTPQTPTTAAVGGAAATTKWSIVEQALLAKLAAEYVAHGGLAGGSFSGIGGSGSGGHGGLLLRGPLFAAAANSAGHHYQQQQPSSPPPTHRPRNRGSSGGSSNSSSRGGAGTSYFFAGQKAGFAPRAGDLGRERGSGEGVNAKDRGIDLAAVNNIGGGDDDDDIDEYCPPPPAYEVH